MKTCPGLKAALRGSDILGQMIRDGDIDDPYTLMLVREALAAVGDAEDINPDACPWRNGISSDVIDLTRDISDKLQGFYALTALLVYEGSRVTRTSGEVLALIRRFAPWLTVSQDGNERYATGGGEDECEENEREAT